MLFLFAIVLGLGFGLLTGGRIGNLARLRFRWPWLILGALVVREAIVRTPLSQVEGAQYAYVLALASILAWTIWHFSRLRAIWLVTVGSAMNLLVIVVNGARMPVAAELAGPILSHGTLGQYRAMGPDTHLNLLADWIRLYPSAEVYSPGDVLIAIGLAVTVFIATATPARIVD
ncbi:MAG TPA: DUF5317 family protein [Candidatus Dormibacteraeota bacterium]|nr:DUF5317 family protein [Candidatus Dormibacteraeota bacterium]